MTIDNKLTFQARIENLFKKKHHTSYMPYKE